MVALGQVDLGAQAAPNLQGGNGESLLAPYRDEVRLGFITFSHLKSSQLRAMF